MPIAIAKIEELAPDQASLGAASKLKKQNLWSGLACAPAGLFWGECQGSGASPYRVICSESDLGYKCTCPSRKFPCKHVLALMWMRADGAPAFAPASPPQWVEDWVARRRPGTGPAKDARNGEAPSVRLAETAEPAAYDPKAEARAAAQRERTRAEREAAIASGLDELDMWIQDALQRGLASILSAAEPQCRTIVQRLVDAKASGLASLAERLPADILSVPQAARPELLIERLAALHLVSRAYRNQSRLPDPIKADIRQLVGWSTTRETLLADAAAPRTQGRWMVVSSAAEVQSDKLRRLETWLSRLGDCEALRFAVLIDFVPVSVGNVANAYRTGETFDAELVFFPSPIPLRAIIVEQTGATTSGERWPRPVEDVAGAIARMRESIVHRPWSRETPFAAHGARIIEADSALWLTDIAGDVGLPLRQDEDDLALPLLGVDDIDVFGRWDGHFLSLGLCETPLGRWTPT
jgi:SWIM zinc finger